jgi:hypothetical protein
LHWNSCLNCRCYMWKMGWSGLEWLGKTSWFYQCQIENPCEVIKVHELPQNPPMGSLRKRGMVVVSMWKTMAHSFSFTLDSSILDELKSQTLHFEMFENAKNLEMLIMLLLVKVQPYWPLPNVGNHHSELRMIGILNIIYHPPSMTLWVTSEWTHILIGSLLVVLGDDRLIHIHQNW